MGPMGLMGLMGRYSLPLSHLSHESHHYRIEINNLMHNCIKTNCKHENYGQNMTILTIWKIPMQCGGKANYGKENLCDDSAVPYQSFNNGSIRNHLHKTITILFPITYELPFTFNHFFWGPRPMGWGVI